MNDREYKVKTTAARKMIEDARAKKATGIKEMDWESVATLNAYISGMEQILVVFELGQEAG